MVWSGDGCLGEMVFSPQKAQEKKGDSVMRGTIDRRSREVRNLIWDLVRLTLTSPLL